MVAVVAWVEVLATVVLLVVVVMNIGLKGAMVGGGGM